MYLVATDFGSAQTRQYVSLSYVRICPAKKNAGQLKKT